MANMTRLNFVDELKKRGWSRFLDADLQRYVDWALQDLYNKSGYPRSATAVVEVNTATDEVGFDDLASSAELVRSVERVFAEQAGKLFQLEPADESFFYEVMWPNNRSTSPDMAGVPSHYFVYNRTIYLWQRPNQALDFHIHHQLREDLFTGDGDTTGLPERFDKGLIALAEIHCFRRAHEFDGMSVAMATFNDFLLEELGMEGRTMLEEQERVLPYRA